MAKRPKKYRRHSPAGYAWLMEQARRKEEERQKKKGKRIAYYGQERETADAILRRLKKR